MAKKEQQNKIGESFEHGLPDELVPDFIWDNISSALETTTVPTEGEESAEKIKTSFEEGVEEAVVPPLLWTGIQSSLEEATALHSLTESNNKIKTSFEAGHQDLIPENLWENVENQLEIEGVWQRVLKGLNKRTKRAYWQEKGMQLGIAALALLLLRGCDFGEWSSTTPLANESNITAKAAFGKEQATPISARNTKVTPNNPTTLNTATTTPNNLSKNNLLEETYTLPTAPTSPAFWKTPSTGNSETADPIAATNSNRFNNTSISTGTKGVEQNSNQKESKTSPSVKMIAAGNNSNPSIADNKKATIVNKQTNSVVTKQENTMSNEGNQNPSGTIKSRAISTNKNQTIAKNTLPEKAIASSNHPVDKASNNTLNKTRKTATTATTTTIPTRNTKDLLSETPLFALIGQPFIDSSINELHAFEIDHVVNKKKHNLRFELGMNGKVGSSLLLGNATNRAMETTSMVKTKTRASGGIGLMLDCYLTANDAIVFAAYPLSNSQQYFGGYTSEGRYYHKEVKLAYFDFTLGYQRTLFHYNDFGTVPSSMYARLDYGLGYLSKSEEIINGLAAELGDSYNKINHNIGLTIGNTHRINRFVIDYGIYGNIGLSSVQNTGLSGANSVDYSNLATMGGYIGLRYVL